MHNQGTLITRLTKTGKGGVKEGVTNRAKAKELESYENIIQNLSRLKIEAQERNHEESDAIEQIRDNLSILRDSLQNPAYA